MGFEGPDGRTKEQAAIQSVTSTWLRKRSVKNSFDDSMN